MDGLELINERRKIFPEIGTILVAGLSIMATEFDAKMAAGGTGRIHHQGICT